MAGNSKEPVKGQDSARDVARAIIDLGAECPNCHSFETIEGNKKGTVRICNDCGHQYRANAR